MTMTREEQITFEADKYTDTRNNYVEWGNGWEDFDDKEYIEKAFQAGAKWADENPKEGLVSIDKVCEWIGDAYLYGVLDKNCDAIIQDFREAMVDK